MKLCELDVDCHTITLPWITKQVRCTQSETVYIPLCTKRLDLCQTGKANQDGQHFYSYFQHFSQMSFLISIYYQLRDPHDLIQKKTAEQSV